MDMKYGRDCQGISSVNRRVLGVLCLDEPIPESVTPGGLNNPGQFDFDVIYRRVPGATLDRTLLGDPDLIEPFIQAAQQLQDEGAIAITSNCGFTISYQADVAAATSTLTALSSLQLLPLVCSLLSPIGTAGIVSFDGSKLKNHHLRLAWRGAIPEIVRISGIEGKSSWKAVIETADYDYERMKEDVMFAVSEMTRDPRIEALLIECAAFTDFSTSIQAQFHLPVFDYVQLARILIGATDRESDNYQGSSNKPAFVCEPKTGS